LLLPLLKTPSFILLRTTLVRGGLVAEPPNSDETLINIPATRIQEVQKRIINAPNAEERAHWEREKKLQYENFKVPPTPSNELIR
jgi:hypothetical protein